MNLDINDQVLIAIAFGYILGVLTFMIDNFLFKPKTKI